MKGLFERGIEEFNRQEFFEAHDTWEELWMDTRGNRRLFYQGLIQTAVGFYHLCNENYKGACSQLSRAVTKLETYPPVFEGIRTMQLVDRLKVCLHKAEKLREGRDVRFDETLIPYIAFDIAQE